MRRIAVGIGGVVLLAVLVSSFAIGVGAAQGADNGTNASLGAEISSFMQASDTETANEFDDEMFVAAMNRSTDPEERRALIETRTDRLEERNSELRAQREGLDDEQDVRSHAIATRVAVGSSGLERAANRTEAAARGVGANTDRIDDLRSSAREIGSDVVGLTPGVAGPPGENVRGPPDGAPGSSENRSTDERSTTPGPAANRSDNAAENGSAGPPDEGNGNAGPPNEGNGNAGPPNEGNGSADPPDDRNGSADPPDDGNGSADPPDDGNGSADPPDEGNGDESGPSDEGDASDRSDRSDNEGSSGNGDDRSESNSNGNGEGTGPPPEDGSEASDRSNGNDSSSDRASGGRPN